MNFDKYFNWITDKFHESPAKTAKSAITIFCPYCGEEMSPENNFCPYCGEEMDLKKSLEEKAVEEVPSFSTLAHAKNKFVTTGKIKRGIILTDTYKLALAICKSTTYSYKTNSKNDKPRKSFSTQELFITILNTYIENMAKVGIVYELLDVSNIPNFNAKNWQDYAKYLYDYHCSKSIDKSEKLWLFILGGNDVIPIPQVVDFFSNSALCNRTSTKHLDVDMLYAYCNCLSSIVNNQNKINYDIIQNSTPVFWVGRLPSLGGFVPSIDSPKQAFLEFYNYFFRIWTEYKKGILINEHITNMWTKTRRKDALLFLGTYCNYVQGLDGDTPINNNIFKHYLNYISKGYSAGEALGLAKIDCMHNIELSHFEILTTILEFNLFGDPSLSVQPMLGK